jgi:hypothetical protein
MTRSIFPAIALAYSILSGLVAMTVTAGANGVQPIPANAAAGNGGIISKVQPACVGTACPAPFSKPDILTIQGLPNGAINLMGPVKLVGGSAPYFAETAAAGWATRVIQQNVSLTPANAEVIRLSQPLDLLAGEALTDDTWTSPSLPAKVKNASVVLHIPVSVTGTGWQWNPLPTTCGVTCTPDYTSDGTNGMFMARLEDCLSANDHTTLHRVLDGGGNSIPCSSADGVQSANNGYWYDLGPPWSQTVQLLIPSMSTNTTSGTLSIPADLPVPANSLRIELALGLTDGSQSSTASGAASSFIDSLVWGVVNGGSLTVTGGPEFALTRFAIQLPTVVVLPAAFLQMKVLPYTIVYRPPGDQSAATYTTTKSYGTTMAVGSGSTFANNQIFANSYGVSSGEKVTALIATVQEADNQTQSNSSTWDSNTTIGTGLTVSMSHTTVRSTQVGSQSPSSDASIVPASPYVTPSTCTAANFATNGCAVQPAESYNQEPFWADRVVLLLNPQAALWDFGGNPALQLLGADDFQEMSIKDLSTCAASTNQNAWKLNTGAYLTPTECQALAALDPFYGEGQWLDPSLSGRGLRLGSGSYGRDPLSPTSAVTDKFSDIFTYQSAQSTNANASYLTSVTDIIGFSWSAGLTLSAQEKKDGLSVGFSADTGVTQGETQTTGTSMRVTYTASTVATDTSATQIDGVFADDHDFLTPACQQNSGVCYTPSVVVFLDELFGSYMLQDPNAACASANLLTCHPLPGPFHFTVNSK